MTARQWPARQPRVCPACAVCVRTALCCAGRLRGQASANSTSMVLARCGRVVQNHRFVIWRNDFAKVYVKCRTDGQQGSQRRVSNLVDRKCASFYTLVGLPADTGASNHLLLGEPALLAQSPQVVAQVARENRPTRCRFVGSHETTLTRLDSLHDPLCKATYREPDAKALSPAHWWLIQPGASTTSQAAANSAEEQAVWHGPVRY